MQGMARSVTAASIVVACEGPGVGVVRDGPAGPRRSRTGANLAFVQADAHHWDQVQSEGTSYHKLFVNPTKNEVLEAVADAIVACNASVEGGAGGRLDFAFAGHGNQDGSLVLSDNHLAPQELVDAVVGATRSKRRQALGIVLDCCFSGRALAEIICSDEHATGLILVEDGFAAALHDEEAFEIDSLNHGALTFTMRYPGNRHVDQSRLARAVNENDDEYLRYALQGFVPNPVAYLTEGDQHSIDLTNGHYVEVKGGGHFDVLGRVPVRQVLDALEAARHADCGASVSI